MAYYAKIGGNGRITEAHNDGWRRDDALPDGAILMTEAEFRDRFNLRRVGGAWVNDPPVETIEQTKARKTREMERAYAQYLAAGYSDGVNIHPLTDRGNLDMTAQTTKARVHGAAKAPYKIWAVNAQGKRFRLSLSETEIVDLATDVADYISAANDRLADRWDSIDSASTIAEVDAVTW